MDSLDKEYFQVVGIESGYASDGRQHPNVESAKDAACSAASQGDDSLAIVKITVKTVATVAKTVTVEVTDVA